MVLPDVNVLIAAAHRQAGQHRAAGAWLEAAFDAAEGVGLAWVALIGFVRISTRRGIFERPMPVEMALEILHRWLGHPNARVLSPGQRHAELLSRLLLGAGAAGNLTTDAHLAALAIEHGARLASFDRDFERFAGLPFEWLGGPRSRVFAPSAPR